MGPREFAIEVVKKLQAAGFSALWAGGCVRDALAGREPKDYDVATDARPEQVRELFGKKRTLAIGASFGVIAILGPRSAGQIEVATFRRDGGYSDGRHPDSVEFTDAREDANRRDFTINGMFFDPIEEKVIDYVGGQSDMDARVIRAIGDPHKRFEEDKLRMLRAIRFATTFGFEIDAETLKAIQKRAGEITVVSSERIGVEMRKILSHSERTVGVQLLRESDLLRFVLPGSELLIQSEEEWNRRLSTLGRLEAGCFETALAIFAEPILQENGVDKIFDQWRLTNTERNVLTWVTEYKSFFASAPEKPWSALQPILIHPSAPHVLKFLAAESDTHSVAVEYCRERLAWPAEKLDPPPFLDGGDLISIGKRPGKSFSKILSAVRAGQLDGKISSRDEAFELAKQMN